MGERRLEANGLTFRVLDEGDGPPVLLLHGFPDTADLWRAQIAALAAAGFRAIAPDLRGRGETDMPDGVEAYRMHHILDDLAGILDALDVPRAHVVGHDWGAATAWVFAIARADRVDKLAVLAVGHPATRFPLSLKALRRAWYFFLFEHPFAEDVLIADDWRLFREWLGDQAARPYIGDLARPGRLTAGLNWYRANVPAISLTYGKLDLPPVKTDTLGVFGAREFALTEEAMLRSEEYVEGTWRYELFGDSGHWMMHDEPERMNALLVDFLRG